MNVVVVVVIVVRFLLLRVVSIFVVLFFFFKQKTAYEMRISDWSSDVCSSDLPLGLKPLFGHPRRRRPDLMLGFKVGALRLQRPVIYAGVYIQLGQPLVDMIGPGHAPFLQQRRAVTLAHLLAEALRATLAHRQHEFGRRPGTEGVSMYV